MRRASISSLPAAVSKRHARRRERRKRERKVVVADRQLRRVAIRPIACLRRTRRRIARRARSATASPDEIPPGAGRAPRGTPRGRAPWPPAPARSGLLRRRERLRGAAATGPVANERMHSRTAAAAPQRARLPFQPADHRSLSILHSARVDREDPQRRPRRRHRRRHAPATATAAPPPPPMLPDVRAEFMLDEPRLL